MEIIRKSLSASKEGRDFISLHDAILDILLNSDTWKSLPIENFFMEEY